VLAVLAKGRPGSHVWLIDSLQKRCRFLQTVVDELELPATVVWGRAEAQALKVDIVTARAVAPMEKLLGYAQPCLSRGAQGLFLKGEKAEAELQEAAKSWHVAADLTVSRSDPRGRIVTVRSLRSRGNQQRG
jgi:16S rRNA (guanine527-N7)-methyltransferase